MATAPHEMLHKKPSRKCCVPPADVPHQDKRQEYRQGELDVFPDHLRRAWPTVLTLYLTACCRHAGRQRYRGPFNAHCTLYAHTDIGRQAWQCKNMLHLMIYVCMCAVSLTCFYNPSFLPSLLPSFKHSSRIVIYRSLIKLTR